MTEEEDKPQREKGYFLFRNFFSISCRFGCSTGRVGEVTQTDRQTDGQTDRQTEAQLWILLRDTRPSDSVIGNLPLNCPDADIVLYADDTTCSISADNPICARQKMSLALNGMVRWFSANKLTLNTKKTVICVTFGQGETTWFSHYK